MHSTTLPLSGCARDRDHEPGNATRYDLFLARDDRGAVLFGWLNAPGGGRCAVLPNGKIHPGYLAEKMGIDYDRRIVDFREIMAWLSDQGVDVHPAREW